jgi:hypothetical protein
MGGVSWAIPATKGTWTAISPLPGLSAVALWGQGDTWAGGGLFTSNNSYWLHSGSKTFPLRDNGELKRDFARPALSRWERDGWKPLPGDIYERELPHGWRLTWQMPKSFRGGYQLRHDANALSFSCSTWDWAEWDRTRLVWSEAGRLFCAQVNSGGISEPLLLRDFNL